MYYGPSRSSGPSDAEGSRAELLKEVWEMGDDPAQVTCYYQWYKDPYGGDVGIVPPSHRSCTLEHLPMTVPYIGDGGQSLTSWFPLVAYSERYTYVQCVYDDGFWFEAVPKDPALLPPWIPVYGGG